MKLAGRSKISVIDNRQHFQVKPVCGTLLEAILQRCQQYGLFHLCENGFYLHVSASIKLNQIRRLVTDGC